MHVSVSLKIIYDTMNCFYTDVKKIWLALSLQIYKHFCMWGSYRLSNQKGIDTEKLFLLIYLSHSLVNGSFADREGKW